MSTPLTSLDVARLLAEPSAEARAELADKIGATMSEAGLTPAEADLARDIVRILARARSP